MPVDEAPWNALHDLPRALWRPALVSACGTAAERLRDTARWRASLLAGELAPADVDFGAPDAAAPLREACGALGLPALAQGREPMAEQVLRTLLWHLDHLADLQPRLSRAEAIAQVTAEFADAWREEKGGWDEVLALLQGLGDLARCSRDELRGLLTSREWQEARRVAAHLQALPELVALIRRLGRSQHAVAGPRKPPPAAMSGSAPHRAPLRAVQTRLHGLPGELHGIVHTARFEQQLAGEAAMLMHPVLAKLWRARRAEGRLLGHDTEAVLVDWRPDPAASPRHAAAEAPPERRERGPMIVALDTSGSMRGAPETLAKAVVLEVLRTAHRERRACVLLAFGAAGEVVEHELALTPAGLEAMLALMGQSFDGGTDVQAPIERAIARVHEAGWNGADLLIVSDGEFGCVPATLQRLDDARRDLGLAVQGVLIGDRETLGLLEVVDDIHWLRDWRRHDDAAPRAGFSPVHSKSLTALYFPNALSARAARHQGR